MDFLTFIKEKWMLLLSLIGNVILLGGLIVFIYLYFNYDCNCTCNDLELEKENLEVENVQEEIQEKSFFVEIKGAVQNPNVYEVTNNNIINDVITMAGGLTKDAYTDNINLSKKLVDEMVIYIYQKKDFNKESSKEKVDNVCVCPDYDITICTKDNQSEIIPSDTEEKNNIQDNISSNDTNTNVDNSLKKKININLATIDDLKTLTGIGDAKAQKIIEYRQLNNGFKSIEEIKNVSGIGDSIYAKIKDDITI